MKHIHSVPLPPWKGIGEGDALFHPHPASHIKGEELKGLNDYNETAWQLSAAGGFFL